MIFTTSPEAVEATQTTQEKPASGTADQTGAKAKGQPAAKAETAPDGKGQEKETRPVQATEPSEDKPVEPQEAELQEASSEEALFDEPVYPEFVALGVELGEAAMLEIVGEEDVVIEEAMAVDEWIIEDANMADPYVQVAIRYCTVSKALVRRVCKLSDEQKQQLKSLDRVWLAAEQKKLERSKTATGNKRASFKMWRRCLSVTSGAMFKIRNNPLL